MLDRGQRQNEAVDENGGSRGRCPHCGGLIESAPGEGLTVGDLTLDVGAHRLWRRGALIGLAPIEFQVMAMFMEHPGQLLSHSQIYDRVWGYDFGTDSNRLNVVMAALRRKLGEPRVIETVRGLGYALRALSSTAGDSP